MCISIQIYYNIDRTQFNYMNELNPKKAFENMVATYVSPLESYPNKRMIPELEIRFGSGNRNNNDSSNINKYNMII